MRKYPALFVITDKGIHLADGATASQSARPLVPVAASAVTGGAAATSRNDTSVQNIERDLLADDRFRDASDIDDAVPAMFGLYAIRVREIESLPTQYRAIAQERDSRLIYLGEAAGQTLRRRLLRNELRGQGHGTFFRSIGAVLGYRPPAGSLVGKANQRNYQFSSADTARIVGWINANLEVSWVAVNDEIHANEVALIRRFTPILNLRDNPRALQQLSALRAECSAIAATRTVTA